jgi:hypothetical protein
MILFWQAACGLTNKPKEQIVDIDAGDIGNDLAAVEYVEDIYKFYKLIEVYSFFKTLQFNSVCVCVFVCD